MIIKKAILGNISCKPYIPSYSQELSIARKVRGNLDGLEELNLLYSYESKRRRNLSLVFK